MKVQNKIDKLIFGVILAAGYSSRFGSEKLIVKIKGKSIIKHVAEKVNNSTLNDFVVIAGKNYPVIKNEIPEFENKIKEIPDNIAPLSCSVRFSLSVIPENTDAVVFILGDMPLITTGLINRMIDKYIESGKKIIFPFHDNTIGNPKLFDKIYFDELKKVTGDRGGRDLVSLYQNDSAGIKVNNGYLFMDIDTEEDLERISSIVGNNRDSVH